MRAIKRIYCHCTGSMVGTVDSIRKFHTASPPAGRGWRDIGYHYVVLNPYPTLEELAEDNPLRDLDGSYNLGRRIEIPGAHVGKIVIKGKTYPGDNAESVAIALIGGNEGILGRKSLESKYGPIPLLLPFCPFSEAQIRMTLSLCKELMRRFRLGIKDVLGHYEWPSGAKQGKTCPDLDMNRFRVLLDDYITSKKINIELLKR